MLTNHLHNPCTSTGNTVVGKALSTFTLWHNGDLQEFGSFRLLARYISCSARILCWLLLRQYEGNVKPIIAHKYTDIIHCPLKPHSIKRLLRDFLYDDISAAFAG